MIDPPRTISSAIGYTVAGSFRSSTRSSFCRWSSSPTPIRTAFHGIVLDDDKLKSISLEYLEQVLPPDIRTRLWPFIGDLSEHQRRVSARGMDAVVADLLRTGSTLFGDDTARDQLRQALEADDSIEDF